MRAAGLLGDGDFLDRFKAYGWYLDDLVLEPVNRMTWSERLATCRNACASLADRIAEYRPGAIVSILLRIKDIVEAAAISAGSDAPRYAVPLRNRSATLVVRSAAIYSGTLHPAELLLQHRIRERCF